jgi:uncharacterized SAM-binding protein YcdF (DUF218 family)
MQTFLYYLSKILRPIFASPYFVCLLVALIAFIALPVQDWKKRVVKFAGIAAILVLGILSTPAVSRSLVKSWETPLGSSVVLAAGGKYDAILVLGGCVDTMTSVGEQLMLNDAAERLTAAVSLYKGGIAPRILYSGGSGYVDQNIKEAPIAMEILRSMGVPREAIILETEARNTFENALFSQKIMEEQDLRRVVLVTSAWHMPRSQAIFRKAGMEFTPYAVDTLAEYYGIPGDYLPDARALDVSTRILRERIGFAAYQVLGRL